MVVDVFLGTLPRLKKGPRFPRLAIPSVVYISKNELVSYLNENNVLSFPFLPCLKKVKFDK